MFRKNTAGQFIHVQGVDSATGGIKSGVTWTVRRCIDGTFAAATGTATEDGTTGWYKFALSQADTNGNNIALNFTGTGAIPQTVNFLTTACDPTSATFGLDIPTALQNADALLNRDMSAVSDTNARSPLNALRFFRNKRATVGTTMTVYKENDSTPAWTAFVETNTAAKPIVTVDPS